METLNVHEAKTRLSAVLLDIETKGTSYIICRNGKPIARLGPHEAGSRLAYHPVASRIEIDYDPTEDLSPEEWEEIDCCCSIPAHCCGFPTITAVSAIPPAR